MWSAILERGRGWAPIITDEPHFHLSSARHPPFILRTPFSSEASRKEETSLFSLKRTEELFLHLSGRDLAEREFLFLPLFLGSRLLPFFLQWMEESGCVAGKEMGWNHFSLPPLR
ncbi:hypothetical protein TNIN_5221 [Trichonephila inaurata madagascariensis]|uniref:Uncharacterized protein n=1 Tax=Trichonephila inaurata madagascariensis TaxID=2747483 RepID=A0A8X6X440_9ARAC|nr:hypothetical protein TNIN_5221 [Trichonephila inaurata madagascariensis]